MPVSSLSNFKGTTHKYGIAVGDPVVYPSEVFIKAISLYKINIGTPGSIAANTTAEVSVSVPGIGINDIILDTIKPTVQVGLTVAAYRIISTGNVGITFSNDTIGALTPTASEIYSIPVLNLT